MGPNKKQLPDGTVKFFFNGIHVRNSQSILEDQNIDKNKKIAKQQKLKCENSQMKYCKYCEKFLAVKDLENHIRVIHAVWNIHSGEIVTESAEKKNLDSEECQNNEIDPLSVFKKFLYSNEIVTENSVNANMDDLISQENPSIFNQNEKKWALLHFK